MRLHVTAVLNLAAIAALFGCNPRAASDSDGQTDTIGDRDTAIAKSAQTTPASAEPPQPEAALLTGRDAADLPEGGYTPDQLYGTWRVEQVTAADGVPAGFTPDRSMIGKTMRFNEAVLGWQDKNGQMETAGLCPEPNYQIAWTVANVRILSKPFRPAWAALNIPLNDVGTMHYWNCGGPDNPGDNTGFYYGDQAFFLIGDDRMIMNWYDGTIMLLRRS